MSEKCNFKSMQWYDMALFKFNNTLICQCLRMSMPWNLTFCIWQCHYMPGSWCVISVIVMIRLAVWICQSHHLFFSFLIRWCMVCANVMIRLCHYFYTCILCTNDNAIKYLCIKSLLQSQNDMKYCWGGIKPNEPIVLCYAMWVYKYGNAMLYQWKKWKYSNVIKCCLIIYLV